MTAHERLWLRCDEKSTRVARSTCVASIAGKEGETVAELRARAAREGWRSTDGGSDTCPMHVRMKEAADER